MGVIPSCLGIVLFLFAFLVTASPIVAAGYPDAFVRATAIAPEMMQSEPAVQGIVIQRIKSQNSGNNQKKGLQPTTHNTQIAALSVSGGGNSTVMAAINSYRKSKGLSPANADTKACAFARTRAAEIAGNFSHDGFTLRIQNKTLPYPSYTTVTENIAQTNDPNNVVPLWINSPGHEKNLTADTPYVCVESSGSYYVMEGWKP